MGKRRNTSRPREHHLSRTKLVEVLKALDKRELTRLRLLVKSPYFTKSAVPAALLDALLKHWPDFNGPELTRAHIFEAIFPGQPFDDQRLRLEMSQLFKLVSTFLQVEHLQDSFESDMALVSQWRNRGLEKLFEKDLRQLEKRQEEHSPVSPSNFLERYQIASEANAAYGSQRQRRSAEHLRKLMQNLDDHYLWIKMKESCEMLNRQRILHQPFSPFLTDELATLLSKQKERALHPAIDLYLSVWQMLKDEDDAEAFYNLVNRLPETEDHLQAEERLGLYKHAQNFCIRQINRGNSQWQEELFALYQSGLEADILTTGNGLAHTDFKNIVTVGLRIGQYEWVKRFMEQYRAKVPAQHRENVYNFCLAYYYNETGQTDKAIRLLQKVSFTDVYYEVSARHQLLNAFYQKEDHEALLYNIEAFRLFLKRNKEISPENRTNQLNYLSMLRRLDQIREKFEILDEKDRIRRVKKLLTDIEEETSLANRQWLLEKTRVLPN